MQNLILRYAYIISLTKTAANWNNKKNWFICGTAQTLKFSIKDLFGKCDQIHSKVRIWWLLLKQSLMGNLIFCAVWDVSYQLQQNFEAFLKLLCEMSVNDYFIRLSNERGKQDSENVTKIQKDRISFWQLHYRLVEKLN